MRACWRPVTRIAKEGEAMRVRVVDGARWMLMLLGQAMGVICPSCQSRPHPHRTLVLSQAKSLALSTAPTRP
jgi:hypothetical protein